MRREGAPVGEELHSTDAGPQGEMEGALTRLICTKKNFLVLFCFLGHPGCAQELALLAALGNPVRCEDGSLVSRMPGKSPARCTVSPTPTLKRFTLKNVPTRKLLHVGWGHPAVLKVTPGSQLGAVSLTP